MKKTLTASILTIAAALTAAPAAANGNHFGWCNGVGNPHRGSQCGASGGTTKPPQQPSNVPVATQKPTIGTGTPQTPGGLPTQVIVVTPQPGQTITGTGQVPQIVVQPGATFTGVGKPIIVLQPLPQQVLTGVSPVTTVTPQPTPSFTGVGLPTVTIQPNPQQTVVGYGKVPATVIVQPVPQPSFTGIGAVPIQVPNATPQAVPQQIPTAVPSPQSQGTPYLIPSLQPQAVPQPTPQRVPQAVPQAKPQATPVLVPQQIPQTVPQTTPQATPVLVPQQIPQMVPQATPQATPVLVPRPKPRPSAQKPAATGGTTTHSQTPARPALAKKHITVAPGRQKQHDLPQFDATDGGQPWRCVASGHGQRRTLIDRRVSVSGALRHIGSIDVLGRDLPALHPQHADCIISLRRKKN